MTRTTDSTVGIRRSAEDERVIEGIVVPYGQVAVATPIGPEAFHPGAFRDSAARWSGRTDGARLPFRPAHKEKPVGSVIELRDTDEGLRFRARIRPGARGDEYLADVDDGQNGVSVEFDAPPSRPTRSGVTVHRQATIYGIAGSSAPAYDGARISLRDMEDEMTEPNPTPDPQPEPEPEPPAQRSASLSIAERDRQETQAAAGYTQAAIRVTRPETVYNRDATWSGTDQRGRRFSLLSDGWRAKQGDTEAAERLFRHEQMAHDFEVKAERDASIMERAGDVISSEVPGAYPNDYIPGLLTPRILKGRPMGGFFQRFPISDALPKIFPKVTTSTTVAVQAAELTNPAASDFATTAITATPLLYGAETVVSRQVLDGSSPAAEAMVISDMMEAYAQASETVIKTAVEAGATASGTAITAATPYAGATGNVVKYATTRFLPAEAQFVPSALYAVLAVQPDTGSLRPLLAFVNPMNADGTINRGGMSAGILGAEIFHSYASTTNVVVTARADDYVIFESPIARFSYDAVTGPAGVRIGIWAYLVAAARKGGLSVTAA
jgi:HK97 family phage prohead protease